MKRWLLGLLALLCMVSMVACSKSAPSLEGEWQAQDALKKDYTIVMDRIEPNRYTVPSVVGMGARDAIYLLEKVGLRVSVEGRGKVVRQSIPVGRRVSRGERITIVLK